MRNMPGLIDPMAALRHQRQRVTPGVGFIANSEFATADGWKNNTTGNSDFTSVTDGEARVSIGTTQNIAYALGEQVEAGETVQLDLEFRGSGGSIICRVYLVPTAEGYNSGDAKLLYDSGVGGFSGGRTVSLQVLSDAVARNDIIIREGTGVSSRSVYVDSIQLKRLRYLL